MKRQLLLVAGSGRSGTSLMSSIVGNLGFHVPRPWVPTDNSNPRGFGEPQWVVDKHTQLLRQANVHASDARPDAWAETARLCLDEQVSAEVRRWLQRHFSNHDQVLIKDPRLLWFLPLWNRVGNELDANVGVITMLRHPAEVVSSKLYWYPNMRQGDANRVAGWLNTMLYTERATRDYQRVFVRFEDLLEDWTQQVAHVSKEFDIPSLVNARARDQASANELVDHSVRRPPASWEDLDVSEGLAEFAEKVWQDLLSLSTSEADPKETLARLDHHREEYASFYRHAENVAQSTTLAAARAQAGKPRAQPQNGASDSPGSPTDLARSLVHSLLSRRQVVPPQLRNLVPDRVKQALVKLVG